MDVKQPVNSKCLTCDECVKKLRIKYTKNTLSPRYVKDNLESCTNFLLHLVMKSSLLWTMKPNVQLIHVTYRVMNTAILSVSVRPILKLKQGKLKFYSKNWCGWRLHRVQFQSLTSRRFF